MLTPLLDGIRNRLRARSPRTSDEQRLLDELERIDRSGDLDDAATRIKESERLGPTPGTCPCCGRST